MYKLASPELYLALLPLLVFMCCVWGCAFLHELIRDSQNPALGLLTRGKGIADTTLSPPTSPSLNTSKQLDFKGLKYVTLTQRPVL